MTTANSLIRTGKGVLVLDHHGFGNVVMSLPLLESVSSLARDDLSVFVLFASPAHFELIRENNFELRPLYLCDYPGWRGLLNLRRQLQGKIDLILGVPQIPARIIFLLKVILGARYSGGESLPAGSRLLSFAVKKSPNRSILEAQSELLKALRFPTPSSSPKIQLTVNEVLWGKKTLSDLGAKGSRPIIAIHASSEKQNKRWPADRFGVLVKNLSQIFPQMAIVSVGSASERAEADLARGIAQNIPWLEGTGVWTLRETASVLSQCTLLITGDTGLMHVAASVGTRTVAIFGPTSPLRLAPTYNAGDYVKPSLPCHPCYEKPGCEHCVCIRLIQIADVVKRAELLLKDFSKEG